eukprot:Skav224025  [mRNA]  locus=scaffold3968:27289:35035:- [translate_table: standard]
MLKHEEQLAQKSSQDLRDQPRAATRPASHGQPQDPSDRRKQWMVTDDEFRDFVLSLAKSQDSTQRNCAVPQPCRCSQESKAKKEMIFIHIYFVDSQFKKFDYHRRKWLGGFQKDWVPAGNLGVLGLALVTNGLQKLGAGVRFPKGALVLLASCAELFYSCASDEIGTWMCSWGLNHGYKPYKVAYNP